MAGVQEAIEDNSGALNKIAEASEIVSTGLEFVGVVAEIGSHIPVIGELCDTIKSLLELLGSFSVVLNEVLDVGKRAGETAELMSEVMPIVKQLPEEKQRRITKEVRLIKDLIFDEKEIITNFNDAKWYKKAWSIVSRSELDTLVEKDQIIMEALTRLQRFIQALTLGVVLDIRFQPPMDLSPVVQEIVAHIDEYMKQNELKSAEAAEQALTADPTVIQEVAVRGGMSKEEFVGQLESFSGQFKEELHGELASLLDNYSDAVIRESKIIQKQQKVLPDLAEANDQDMKDLKENQQKVLKNQVTILSFFLPSFLIFRVSSFLQMALVLFNQQTAIMDRVEAGLTKSDFQQSIEGLEERTAEGNLLITRNLSSLSEGLDEKTAGLEEKQGELLKVV